MFKLTSPSQQEQIRALAMRQIEKLLKEMQNDGKDLSRLKLKKFQKTHHIDCKCKLCEIAKTKNDPRLRGLLEDGFKVYVDGGKKSS
jgi:hypothetical protein